MTASESASSETKAPLPPFFALAPCCFILADTQSRTWSIQSEYTYEDGTKEERLPVTTVLHTARNLKLWVIQMQDSIT